MRWPLLISLIALLLFGLYADASVYKPSRSQHLDEITTFDILSRSQRYDEIATLISFQDLSVMMRLPL